MTDWRRGLDVWDITFLPISALHGINVVTVPSLMNW